MPCDVVSYARTWKTPKVLAYPKVTNTVHQARSQQAVAHDSLPSQDPRTTPQATQPPSGNSGIAGLHGSTSSSFFSTSTSSCGTMVPSEGVRADIPKWSTVGEKSRINETRCRSCLQRLPNFSFNAKLSLIHRPGDGRERRGRDGAAVDSGKLSDMSCAVYRLECTAGDK